MLINPESGAHQLSDAIQARGALIEKYRSVLHSHWSRHILVSIVAKKVAQFEFCGPDMD